MRWTIRNIAALCGATMALGSCGMESGVTRPSSPPPAPVAAAPRSPVAPAAVQDLPVKIGEPYQIAGQTYTPAKVQSYDEVGFASWYGGEAGTVTANGEAFSASAVSGAHKTLPLPSYVEVTALDTGRTIVVRLNDRGPFVGDRLIDLSRGAAGQLGMSADGSVPVRVRLVNPSEQERAVLRSGGRAAERLKAPPALLMALRARLPDLRGAAAPILAKDVPTGVTKEAAITKPPAAIAPIIAAKPTKPAAQAAPKPGTLPVPVATSAPASAPAKGRYVVQAAALSSREHAESAAKSVGGFVASAGKMWRVRLGPYVSTAAAKAGLERAAAAGFKGAKIMVND